MAVEADDLVIPELGVNGGEKMYRQGGEKVSQGGIKK